MSTYRSYVSTDRNPARGYLLKTESYFPDHTIGYPSGTEQAEKSLGASTRVYLTSIDW